MKNSSLPLVPLIMSAAAVLIGGAMLCLALVVILRPNQAAEVTPTDEPAEISTNIPTATVAPTNTPTATATVQPTTAQTATPTATATSTNAPTNLPRPTNTPTQTFTPSVTVDPYLDSRIKNATFTVLNTTPAVKEHIIFRFSITNATGGDLYLGYAGPGVFNSAGQQIHHQQSWSNFTMKANDKLDWEDWVAVDQPGTYTIKMMVCFSSTIACDNGTGEWKVIAPPVSITAH